MAEEFQIGDRVDVNGQLATVRYVGTTDFAPGDWIGVELDVPDGKNNGTVQGVRYFECAEKYGKFYKANVPRLVERAPQQAHRPQARQSLRGAASIGQMKVSNQHRHRIRIGIGIGILVETCQLDLHWGHPVLMILGSSEDIC